MAKQNKEKPLPKSISIPRGFLRLADGIKSGSILSLIHKNLVEGGESIEIGELAEIICEEPATVVAALNELTQAGLISEPGEGGWEGAFSIYPMSLRLELHVSQRSLRLSDSSAPKHDRFVAGWDELQYGDTWYRAQVDQVTTPTPEGAEITFVLKVWPLDDQRQILNPETPILESVGFDTKQEAWAFYDEYAQGLAEPKFMEWLAELDWVDDSTEPDCGTHAQLAPATFTHLLVYLRSEELIFITDEEEAEAMSIGEIVYQGDYYRRVEGGNEWPGLPTPVPSLLDWAAALEPNGTRQPDKTNGLKEAVEIYYVSPETLHQLRIADGAYDPFDGAELANEHTLAGRIFVGCPLPNSHQWPGLNASHVTRHTSLACPARSELVEGELVEGDLVEGSPADQSEIPDTSAPNTEHPPVLSEAEGTPNTASNGHTHLTVAEGGEAAKPKRGRPRKVDEAAV